MTVRVDAGVADVRLDRPDKLNAVDRAMFEALADAGHRLEGDRSVRAVVISGEGKGFCAGLDVAALASPPGGDGAQAGSGGLFGPEGLVGRLPGRVTNLVQEVADVWASLPVPTIAAVHGVALGAGLQIAIGADLRIVAPDAQLSVLEIRWGLVPDMTGTYRLPRLVGLDTAKELCWTGRMVSGEEAVGMGLATRLAANPRRAALELAASIAGANPDAVSAAKALLERSLASTAAEQYLAESAAMEAILGSPNQVEAVLARLEQRPAAYADRQPVDTES